LAISYAGKTATLTWTNNGSVAYTYLKTYYKLSSEPTTWTTDSEILAGDTVTRDIAVSTENTDYDFRIRAYYSTSGLNSVYNTVTAQTSGISAPTNCEATCESGTIVDISWTDNSSVEDGFEVYRDSDLLTTTAADETSYQDTTAEASTTYIYKVRAKKDTAYSDYSIADSVKTGDPPDAAPVIGTVTAVTGSSSSLVITWTDTATNATNFYIYRSIDDTNYVERDNVEDEVETYTDTGLVSHTTYYYKVRAYNAAGYSAYSSSANGATNLDLDPPTSVVAEDVSSTQITLSWTANASDATTHNIERKIAGEAYSEIKAVAAGTNTYTDGALDAGVEYTYRIRAYHSTPPTYGEYSVPVSKTISVATETPIAENKTYFAMGRYLCVAQDDPENLMDCYWTSKPLDFSDQDPQSAGRFKTVDKVELDYIDRYAYTPITVSISTDNGVTWAYQQRSLGLADGASKRAIFWLGPLTGEHFTLKLESNDDYTAFTITGIRIHYELAGPTMEDAG
jgi:hypothetical protein